MPNNYGVTYHVIMDGMENAAVDELVSHLAILQPAWINISGGSRFTQALQLVERLRRDTPNINVILRQVISYSGVKDNGVWKAMTPEQWYNAWIAPNKAWLKQYKPYFMTDNEGAVGGPELRNYSDWMAKAIMLCAADGIQLAVGRFPTGVPEFSDYQYLDSMFRAIEKYGGVWSPNEYFGQTPQLSNSLPGRFMHGLDYCDKAGIKRPTVVIGEYGACYAHFGDRGEIVLDPYKGFAALGWTQEQLFEQAMSYFEPWIQPGNASVCAFAVGAINEFSTFRVDRPFYDKNIAYKSKGKGIVQAQSSQPADPPQETYVKDGLPFSDPSWVKCTLAAKSGSVNVRTTPSTQGNNPIGTISAEKPGYYVSRYEWGDWGQVRYDNDKVFGWANLKYLDIRILPVEDFVALKKTDYDQVVSDLTSANSLLQKSLQTLKK